MNSQNQYVTRSETAITEENARFMAGVYKWMAFGILLTGATSYYISLNKKIVMTLATNSFISIGLFLAQIGAVIFLAAMIEKISAFMATVVYLLYAFFTGISLCVVLLIPNSP